MTTYWLSDFCSLFNSYNINPFIGDNKNFKFNSLTRLIIFVTLLFALLNSKNSNQILTAGVISIFLSIIFYMFTYNLSTELSVSNNKNVLENYKESQEILKDINKDLETNITKTGQTVIDDYRENNRNNISFDYTPQNTDLKKQSYFFEGNNMPKNVTETKINENEYISRGREIETGTAKRLHSLINKNL